MAGFDFPEVARGEFRSMSTMTADYDTCMSCLWVATLRFGATGRKPFLTICAYGPSLTHCARCTVLDAKDAFECHPAAGLMTANLHTLLDTIKWFNEEAMAGVGGDAGDGDNNYDEKLAALPVYVRQRIAIAIRTLALAFEKIEVQHRQSFDLGHRFPEGLEERASEAYTAQVDKRREVLLMMNPRPRSAARDPEWEAAIIPRLLPGDHHYGAWQVALRAFLQEVEAAVEGVLDVESLAFLLETLPDLALLA